MSRPNPAAPARLLVRLPNPIGDAIAATPLLAALRQRFPETRILLAGSNGNGSVLSGLESYDGYLSLPPSRGLRKPWRHARYFRDAQADTVLLLTNSWSSALAAKLADIPERIGRERHRRAWILTRSLPPIGGPRPMAEIYFEMMTAFDTSPAGSTSASTSPVSASALRPRLAITPTQEQRAEARLEDQPQGPYLGVAPGASFGPSKSYPPELVIEAVRLARERTGWIPMILGGPKEEELMAAVHAGLEAPVLATHERLADLGEMKALLKRCAVLFTMDTGARHMAAALDVPQVVLYGPTDPRWSATALEQTRILRRDEVDCSPCHRTRCPIDHRCMTRIPPEEVAEALVAVGRPPAVA